MSEEEKRDLAEQIPADPLTRKPGALLGWAETLVAAVLAVVLIFLFVAQLFVVQGPSMQNTLYGGDLVLVLKPYLTGGIRAGDVVVVHPYNAELGDTIIKRVVATEGQTVDIDYATGTVYVDGTALEEEYIAERTYTDEGTVFPLTVGEGELFLMGDNRNHSTDSRSTMLGLVDQRYVMGKAAVLLFPGRTASYLGETSGTGQRDFSRIGLIG